MRDETASSSNADKPSLSRATLPDSKSAESNAPPARKYSDYIVGIDRAELPGVEIIERL